MILNFSHQKRKRKEAFRMSWKDLANFLAWLPSLIGDSHRWLLPPSFPILAKIEYGEKEICTIWQKIATWLATHTLSSRSGWHYVDRLQTTFFVNLTSIDSHFIRLFNERAKGGSQENLKKRKVFFSSPDERDVVVVSWVSAQFKLKLRRCRPHYNVPFAGEKRT